MKHPDQFASIFCFLVGAGITASSFFYSVGSLAEPGPGFITFLAGFILTLLSVALFISSGMGKEERRSLRQLWEGQQTGKALSIVGLLLAYMLLMNSLGFLLTTVVLLSFLFRVQGTYSSKGVIFLSVLVTAVAFILFDKWLGVQLPRGFWGYFLF